MAFSLPRNEQISGSSSRRLANGLDRDDESTVAISTATIRSRKAGSFPRILHQMLKDAEDYGFQNVVSWLPDGKAFKVRDKKLFASKIMPIYFEKQTKFKSFQRQLNIYSFKRATKGADKGCISHELFLRNNAELCNLMKRGIIPTNNRSSYNDDIRLTIQTPANRAIVSQLDFPLSSLASGATKQKQETNKGTDRHSLNQTTSSNDERTVVSNLEQDSYEVVLHSQRPIDSSASFVEESTSNILQTFMWTMESIEPEPVPASSIDRRTIASCIPSDMADDIINLFLPLKKRSH